MIAKGKTGSGFKGAARYLLYVFHADGGAYWAWEGTATEIYLGGFDTEPDPDVDGIWPSGNQHHEEDRNV